MMAYWSRLNSRERNLALVVLVLGALALGYCIVVPAQRYLVSLDDEIDGLEQELLNDTLLLRRSAAVDDAFAAIAAEHGSELTQYEIHDGLRKEIFRLTMKDMPASAEQGTANAPQIIQWLELPEGTLTEGEEGYREYAIEFRTRPGSLANLVLFLRRIQESPMSLRVTHLDFTRAPEANGTVQAVIGLARTVVDGVPADVAAMVAGAGDVLENGDMELWDEGSGAPGWSAENVVVSRDLEHVVGGSYALRVEASASDGHLFQEIELKRGTAYTLSFAASSEAEESVAVSVSTEAGETYGEPVAIGGALTRYELRFAVPPGEGVVSLRVPDFLLRDAGTVLYVDDVTVNRFEE